MKRRLRVLHLIDSLAPAGAERSLSALAPHLIAAGIDLHVGYFAERDGLREEIERAGVYVTSLDVGESRRARLGRTVELLHETKPDIVHTTLFEAVSQAGEPAAREHIPCISSLVNTAYGRAESGADSLPWLKVRAAPSRRCSDRAASHSIPCSDPTCCHGHGAPTSNPVSSDRGNSSGARRSNARPSNARTGRNSETAPRHSFRSSCRGSRRPPGTPEGSRRPAESTSGSAPSPSRRPRPGRWSRGTGN